MTLRSSALLFSICAAFFACASHSQYTCDAPEREPSSWRKPASALSPRFERKLENEEEIISTVRDGILFIQGGHAKESGKVLRGTHAKGICVKGNMEIADLSRAGISSEIAGRLREGLFSVPGSYPALVRFANADGKAQDDKLPDVRAVSFSLKVPEALSNPQGLMDFAMNNAPTFPIKDARVFADAMTILQYGKVVGGFKVGVSRLLAAKEAFDVGEVQKKNHANTPYQKMRYWSNVPFALGENEAVKYSLTPCMQNSARALTDSPDRLSQELIRNLQQDANPTCFDFQVQLLEANKMKTAKGAVQSEQDWVENALVEWPESDDQAPFYTIGRLSLVRNSQLDPNDCEKWKINVLANSNQAHRGLGSINRARTPAEAASAEQREKSYH